jgi:hypothetical protein
MRELLGRKFAWLQQDAVRNADFADIMQKRCHHNLLKL